MATTYAVPAASDQLVCGPVWISLDEICEARVRGRPVALSDAQRRVLAHLIRAEGRVQSREQLYAVARQGEGVQSSRAIDVHIARIRRAMGELGHFLIAVKGRGYRVDVLGLSNAR
jgi:DNA-binding response OmpR family regulator